MNAGKWRFVLAATLACCLVGGCYNSQEVNAFLLKPRAEVSGVEYRVLPPDIIRLTSLRMPEVDGTQSQIRPDGKINLPLIGELEAAGKTPREIEEMIIQASRAYYEQGDATVNVVAYRSRKFYVFGQVARPGPMPWTGRDTLLDALAASHPTMLAWPERIILVRGDQPQEGGVASTQPAGHYGITGVRPESKDNPRRTMTFNLMAMIESGDMSNNVLLLPNDVIYVQPNPLARVGLALQQLLFPVRPALETVEVSTVATP